MIKTDFLIMPPHPVEMTSAEQEPDPDSLAVDDHTYHSWVTVDHHQFDHNISDSRWADYLFSSEMNCIALIDLTARFLPAKFPGPIEVSVLWTDDLTIAELNQQFRSKSGVTKNSSRNGCDERLLQVTGWSKTQ